MSVQKSEDGKRWISVETEVPGTPEEVWEAIATGPGVSAWFVPTERRDDGTVVSHFGPGMVAVAKQTAYEPPRRFAAESGMMGPDGPVMATEWTVEARKGGTCVVRVVHSLFASTDDWDDQLENVEKGWPDYFKILRIYLTHFKGQPCSAFQLLAMPSMSAADAWQTITDAFGLAGANQGDARKSTGNSPEFGGVVESTGSEGHSNQILMRLDDPTGGVAHFFSASMGGQTIVSIRFYLYGPDAAAAVATQEPLWQAWQQANLPAQGQPQASC